jgi:hypothetical protein
MKNKRVFAALILFLLAVVPTLHAARCSNAAAAGKWGFTTNGTLLGITAQWHEASNCFNCRPEEVVPQR